MLGALGKMNVRIGADTTEFEKLAGRLQKSLAPMSQRMERIGRAMSLSVTAPVTAAGYAVARMGGEFQTSMNRVQALTGSTGSQLEALSDQAKELGISTQFSASQASDAMGFLAMAGFDANQILGTLPDTLNLAAASGMDLARTADVMSNIMQGYGLQTHEAARASDVLTKAFISSNTDLGKLAESMKYAGPVARGMGIEFEEAAAAIGLMGNAGIQGSESGTALRNALAILAKPAADARRSIEGLGLSVDDLNPTTKSLTEIIERLSEAGADTTDILAIFGRRAGPAMQTLLDQGADALSNFTAELSDAGGEAERVASVQMQGFQGAMKGLKSAVEGLALAIAESGVLQFLEKMARRATDLVRQLADMNPAILRTTSIIAGVAAAAGPALLALGSLTKMLPLVGAGFATLTGPIGLTVAAVAGVAAAFTLAGDDTREALADIARSVRTILEPVMRAARGMWEGLRKTVTEDMGYIADTFRDALLNIRDTLRTVSAAIEGDWAAMWESMAGVGERMMEGTARNIAAIFQAAVSPADWPITRMIQGAWDAVSEGASGANRAMTSSQHYMRKVVAESFSLSEQLVGSFARSAASAAVEVQQALKPAPEVNEHIAALARELERVDLIAAAFAGRDPLGPMQDRARILTEFLEAAYARDMEVPASQIASYRAELDALNVTIGETLAARARMAHDRPDAQEFLPGLSDASVALDGLSQRLDLAAVGLSGVQQFARGATDAIATSLSDSISRTIEGALLLEDGFRSLREAVASFGEMARRVMARFIADLAAAAARAALLRGVASIFGFGLVGSFGELFRQGMGITSLASGGIVSRPMPAIVGDAATPEAIVPIHHLEGFIENAMQRVTAASHEVQTAPPNRSEVTARFSDARLRGDDLLVAVESAITSRSRRGGSGILG